MSESELRRITTTSAPTENTPETAPLNTTSRPLATILADARADVEIAAKANLPADGDTLTDDDMKHLIRNVPHRVTQRARDLETLARLCERQNAALRQARTDQHMRDTTGAEWCGEFCSEDENGNETTQIKCFCGLAKRNEEIDAALAEYDALDGKPIPTEPPR